MEQHDEQHEHVHGESCEHDHEMSEMPTTAESTATPAPRSPWMLFGVGIAAGVIICGVVLFAIFSKGDTANGAANFATKFASYFKGSVASINGERVSYSKYISDFQTLKQFVANTPEAGFDFTDEELSDQVLSRLLVGNLIKQLAIELDVTVSDEEIENARKDFLTQFDSEEAAEKELKERYGWTTKEFVEHVITPSVLEGKVGQTFSSSTNPEFAKYGAIQQIRASHILFKVEDLEKDASVKKQAESVLKQIKNGADFAELAKKYGSDGTKDTGGDLGFFGRGAMVPEFEEAAFSLEAGQLKDELVKTQFGYHIVKTTEVKRGLNFQQYLIDRLKASVIDIDDGIHNPFEALLNAPGETNSPTVEAVSEETTKEENS